MASPSSPAAGTPPVGPSQNPDSGESTVPNTPREDDEPPTAPPPPTPRVATKSNEPPPTPEDDNEAVIPTSSGSSDLSSSRWMTMGQIQPTWPKNVNITNAPANVSWQSPSNSLLDTVLLNIHWTSQGNSSHAFFKILMRVRLQLEGVTRTRRGTSIFIFIPPDRIRSLVINTHPEERPLGPDTVHLSFDMFKPPALVLPKVFTAVDDQAQETVRSLHALAAQRAFTMYARISGRTCSAQRLEQLGTAVSTHSVSSIERLGFPGVATLYQGHGGQVIEGDTLPGPDRNVDPPAYSDSPQPLLPTSYPCEYTLTIRKIQAARPISSPNDCSLQREKTPSQYQQRHI